ncbi:choline kinase [Williamsoniiplasma luminosum]|uniref:Choline kinase n=1 Tax=Williamsoniiplasma luminosum TaxID=214888 RepID=A0A2K8NVR6_9MOLU|nr:phosphotransferase [Williamsoniiplasma luminosum]ATZ17278.1 choline kinase [Williamsoniiplasma luminosum]
MKKILNTTNKIKIKNNVFIKTSNKNIDYFMDRENEKKFYEQVQNLDFILVPNQIKHKWNKWVFKMPYYENATTLKLKSLDIQKMKEVIELIHQLQQQKVDLKLFNPQAFLKLFTNKVGVIEELKVWKTEIHLIIENYYDETPPVLSHNDLIVENFLIKDHKMFLIDFEYVSLNHYLFDYASFISEALPKSKHQAFISLLNLTPKELIKLNQLIQYHNFLWAHWAKYLYQVTHRPIYLEIMKQKIRQINDK